MAVPYWRLSGFYLFYFALLGGTAPFLAPWFAYLGFAPARIGELVAIPMVMRCIAPHLWGWLGDRSGHRLRIVRLGAAATLLSFSLVFLGDSYAWLALVMALHAFFWHAVLPQFEVITLAHLRTQPTRYGQVRLWGSIGFIAAVILLGRWFEWRGMGDYPATILVIMAGILLASAWVPAPAREADETSPPPPGDGFVARLRQPGVITFYLCVGLMQLSHGPYYTFFSIHLATLGYSSLAIGLCWALGVVAEVLMFMGMARLLARWPVNTVLLVSFVLAAVRWVLLGGFASNVGMLVLAQVLHAATFGSFHAAAVQKVRTTFGLRYQGQGQALYAALAGVGGALGAVYSGHAWQVLGPFGTFALASVAAFAAAVMMVLFTQKEPV
ncbi:MULTISPECIES: MFS transporter [Pseudomonas]|uniref:MFS transporter n=1 Tax=Pseudomonas quercus TaxID=2722792 RepID=A0ABX0Y9K7_9PSED|nr:MULTISPECIES: MFS transporter [Pseudomonas]MBF7141398.1 MFS transporter [Pseudomonas sp. LY10J]NJO99936.1 MFS transporter [Pseudomonas quercus]